MEAHIWKDLPLISGSVTVTVTLNNFDGYFDMTFTRPNGGSVVIQMPRVALLAARGVSGASGFAHAAA